MGFFTSSLLGARHENYHRVSRMEIGRLRVQFDCILWSWHGVKYEIVVFARRQTLISQTEYSYVVCECSSTTSQSLSSRMNLYGGSQHDCLLQNLPFSICLSWCWVLNDRWWFGVMMWRFWCVCEFPRLSCHYIDLMVLFQAPVDRGFWIRSPCGDFQIAGA